MLKVQTTANAGDPRDTGSILGSGRSAAVRNGTPLQYSCLENCRGRGAWQATVHGVTKSQTQLSDFTFLERGSQIYIRESLQPEYSLEGDAEAEAPILWPPDVKS